MKKIGFVTGIILKRFYSSKFEKIMRLSLLFLFVGAFNLIASNSYSQKTKLTLNIEQSSISQVLHEIESKSEFYFLYNNKLIDVNRKVDVHVRNKGINDILDDLLAGTDVGYLVMDRQIVLSPKELLTKSVNNNKLLARPQQITITGTVTDEQGSPLPGVNVVVKGTTVGTITDADGKYTLSVSADAQSLEFSFIGMITQNVDIGNQTTIDVQMKTDFLGLEEVVVTGYATQMKEALTGSISTLKSDNIELPAGNNLAQRIQGQIPGVSVLNTHLPGADAEVLIRGLGTINNNNPLYVIDGIPTGGGLSQINPNDIESLTVLKDASSAAIYGARGANGVIIITTKRGKPGAPRVDFTARTGVTWSNQRFDLLNSQEYGELNWLEAENEGVAPGNVQYGFGAEPVIPDYVLPAGASEGDAGTDPSLYVNNPPEEFYQIVRANKEGTDWLKEITRNAPYSEYNLNLSGGTNNANYAFSAGYMNEEGIVKYTGFKRYSVRANSDLKVNKWFKAGETLGLTYTDTYGGGRWDNSEASVISACYKIMPLVPVYDIMGYWTGTNIPLSGVTGNPLASLTRAKYNYDRRLRAIGNIYGQATIFKGLDFKTMLGFDFGFGNTRGLSFMQPEAKVPVLKSGVSAGSDNSVQLNWSNLLTYNKVFADKHSVNVLLGTEAVTYSYRNVGAGRQTYFSEDPDYMYINAGETDVVNSGSGYDWRTFSIFGRLNYALSGKYMLQATVRRDGSSRFGKNNRYGIFPAFSAGWKISGEDFMAGTENWLNYLKLRAGWGKSGNDRIGNYNGFTSYGTSINASYYALDGSLNTPIAGYYRISIGNADAKWETTATTDIGLDATLFRGLSINFDYWKRTTSDMLYPVSLPDVWGAATRPSINIGDMKNVGFDLVVGYGGKAAAGNFTYNVSVNISHYKNELLKISDKEKEVILGDPVRGFRYTQSQPGTSFPEFYGFIVDGIFQTQAEADAHAPYGSYNEPGHWIYRDINGRDAEGNLTGEPDGVIDNDDKTYIGSPHPKFTGGLNIDLGYKGFGLSAFFYTSYGNKMINATKRFIDYYMFTGNRSKDRLYRSWGSPYLDDNANAIMPKAEWSDQGSVVPSTAYLEDASYLRLKNLQLSYTIPKSVVQKINFGTLQVYLQANNLFTLTKYSGLDPEIRTSTRNRGIDQGAWPTAKQFLVGLKMGF